MTPEPAERPWTGQTLHFVGIGGAGMSGLALIAGALGASVTGSDQATSPYMEPLRAAGIEPTIGHGAGNVPAGAEVVYSSAIGPENPERAGRRGGRPPRPPPTAPSYSPGSQSSSAVWRFPAPPARRPRAR
jgi:hypothetical protein